MKKSLIFIVIFLAASTGHAEQPDFYIQTTTCKSLLGIVALADNTLQIHDGAPGMYQCFRKQGRNTCAIKFEGGEKSATGSNVHVYIVKRDSPPHLHFGSQDGADYIAIDTAKHAAVILSRSTHETYLAAKICNGVYATHGEAESMGKR